MKRNSKSIYLAAFLLTILSYSCKKDWLEAKPQLSLVVPTTIADYQAILDNTLSTMSVPFNGDQNLSDEIAAGDLYVRDASFDALTTEFQRNMYTWAPVIYDATQNSNGEWSIPYKRIFYSNIVLEGIDKIIPKNNNDMVAWNQVKGSAFFFRAYSHYDVARLFCKSYDMGSPNTDLGIPLRTSSDINIKSVRATVAETYELIITDLKNAASILPVSKPQSDLYQCRPTKTAAFSMLARVYLAMNNFDSALVYATKSLDQYNLLLDFNRQGTTATDSTLANPVTSNTPFARLNDEVIFHMRTVIYGIFTTTRLIVDSTLRRSYSINDWRRNAFFRLSGAPNNDTTFKGSYDASSNFFGGLTTAEMYITRSECYARKGNIMAALDDINMVYRKRWKNSISFQPITATNATEALPKIYLERRKELLFRGLRWTDLKRLNREPAFAVTLSRGVNGQQYTLPPNSVLYILPIPPDVIQLSGIPQNPR